ncbi:Advillin [Trichoplax sp. H2]|nr:Advillin [Trichoplax sp. H2]|eukprot:RDD46509.1 Advillin [Trichoplax sp. H2]
MSDPAFEEAGKTPGLEIWRIEKLEVVKQEPETYGKFYNGDSYICLSTKKKNNKLCWDIHFWLGEETSQDESGVAAYKTVELDELLGGSPVQHREVQNHESSLFLSYFKQGVCYAEGGVESGFKKVERGAYEKRLLHIKGKRQVRVYPVEVNVTSLNDGDCFILDDGEKIYCWCGKDSSRKERMKASDVARGIRDGERGGKARIYIIDDGEDDDSEFFEALGGFNREQVLSAEAGGDDVSFEEESAEHIRLYRISDASGDLETTEVDEKPLKYEHLDHNDSFILDTGGKGIFAWVGSKCTKAEKRSAMSQAVKFIEERNYPKWTPVTQVMDGDENALFKQYFASWPSRNIVIAAPKPSQSNIAQVSQDEIDLKALHQQHIQKKQTTLPDNGDGRVKIWRIENFQKVPVDEEVYGKFYGGDSYILLYKYLKHGTEQYIIYFWLGLKSSQDEQASAAALVTAMDDNLDGMATQIRVVQNKEPEHFLLIFKGKLVIFEGGCASGFKNVNDKDSYDTDGIMLFQIHGTTAFNTKAIQVAERASSLNSNDVFVLKTPQETAIWVGKGANNDEKDMGKTIAKFISPKTDIGVVNEGHEPEWFWPALGGKTEYASGERLQEATLSQPPRLFQCSNASGKFKVEEIPDFDQEDLSEDDVMLLDTYDEVFVWIGEGARPEEKKAALELAVKYVKSDTSGRNINNTTMVQVKQGSEPIAFTCNFVAWDLNKWSNGKSYADLKAELGKENAGVTLISDELAKYNKKYDYEFLISPDLPEEIDACHKERYLTDEDFEKVFNITREEFEAKPQWRQQLLKKQKKLF